jgi:hypothetical protein
MTAWGPWGKSMAKSNDRDPNYKNPGTAKVRLAVFWATNYKSDTSKQVIDQAEKLLGQHNIGLDVYPGKTRTEKHTIKIGDDPILPVTYPVVRGVADAIFIGDKLKSIEDDKRLAVFFCQYKDLGLGITVLKRKPGETTGNPWAPYCFVGSAVDPDNSTLVHEIGHAAHNSGQHSPDKGHIMFEASVVQPRTIIDKIWVQIIARAYFTK